MELTAGTLITQSIRLVRRLGEGGMGTVWVAEHLTLNTTVAVKFILETAKRDPRRITRFKREASIAAKIRNPHVVQIFDYGVMQDETPYIVMELMEGHTLSQRLKRAPLSLAETKLLVSQVAIALTAAHELDITHRDMKPDNLFLIKKSGYDLFVKVLDFGIAKQRNMPSGMTSPGAMMGTPMYMSPEQIESADDVTHHADLWALAVVAYQALLGRPPFEGETMGALCINISKAEFELVTSAHPELPGALDDWFSRALCRDQGARFQSALELANALDAIGGDSPARSSLVPSSPMLISPAESSTADHGVASDADVTGTELAGVPAQRRWRVPLILLLLLACGSIAMVVIKPQAREASPEAPSATGDTAAHGDAPSPSSPSATAVAPSAPSARSAALEANEPPRPEPAASSSTHSVPPAPTGGAAAPGPWAKASSDAPPKAPCRRHYMEGDTVKERPCPDGKAPALKPAGAPSIKPCEGELFINDAGVVERRPC